MHTKSGSQKRNLYFIKEILTLYTVYSPPKTVKFFHNEMSTMKSILWGKTHEYFDEILCEKQYCDTWFLYRDAYRNNRYISESLHPYVQQYEIFIKAYAYIVCGTGIA